MDHQIFRLAKDVTYSKTQWLPILSPSTVLHFDLCTIQYN